MLWAGTAATLAVAWLAALLPGSGISAIRFLGCLPGAGPAGLLNGLLGWLTLLATGTLALPILYALGFEALGRAHLDNGLLLGAVHSLAAGFALPILGNRNRCIRAGKLPPPGPFAYRYGRLAPLRFILAHLLYGAIIGYVYVVPLPA
ncbi:MAG: hypothetical protein HY703_05625 [Gemmatimonadetes bacterium]|nr:hypothetical protein [Gemmatimonadota bacterium]